MLTHSENRDQHLVTGVSGPDHDVFAEQQAVLKSAAQAWKSLPHSEQSRYDKLAARFVQAQMRQLLDQKEEIRERSLLRDQRQTTPDNLGLESRNLLSNCRYTEAELHRFTRVFEKHQHLLKKFQDRHRALQQAPSPPSDLDMELLNKHWPTKSSHRQQVAPSWLKHVAVQREYFNHAVFMQFTSHGPMAWMLLFVMRSPVQAVAMQVHIDSPQMCCAGTGSSSGTAPPVFSQWTFVPSMPRKFQLVHDSLFEDAPLFFVEDVFWEQACCILSMQPRSCRLGLHGTVCRRPKRARSVSPRLPESDCLTHSDLQQRPIHGSRSACSCRLLQAEHLQSSSPRRLPPPPSGCQLQP